VIDSAAGITDSTPSRAGLLPVAPGAAPSLYCASCATCRTKSSAGRFGAAAQSGSNPSWSLGIKLEGLIYIYFYFGEASRIRTVDPYIKSVMLYRLS
jgi:hypothetical protein